MQQISPVPRQTFDCPTCRTRMTVEGYWLPGMHVFAKTRCGTCARRFLSHLSIHFALGTELHLDADSKEVAMADGRWFSTWFNQGARRVIERDPVMRIVRHRELRRPVLVNLVDFLYGHCLQRLYMTLKLLDSTPPCDLLVVAPRFMEWLLPDGIAETWIVDIPTGDGLALFPALARRLEERLSELPPCSIAEMWPLGKVDMTRFTRVRPIGPQTPGVFDRPVLTLSWRDDRLWTYRGRELPANLAMHEQARLVADLCGELRKALPDIDVAVTGYGAKGDLPDWIADMRATERTDAIERAWLERYARSHATIGVYGSNMLLPMALAGGCVQLVTSDYIQALNYATEFVDTRFGASAALGCIFSIPASSSLSDIATVTLTALQRSARSLIYSGGDAGPADWMWKSIQAFRIVDERGGVL